MIQPLTRFVLNAAIGQCRRWEEAGYQLAVSVNVSARCLLDPTFAEQKKIFERCAGLFYRCSGGAEARRFNRLLIDAGLIKGL